MYGADSPGSWNLIIEIRYLEAQVANPFVCFQAIKGMARKMGVSKIEIYCTLANADLDYVLRKRYRVETSKCEPFMDVIIF